MVARHRDLGFVWLFAHPIRESPSFLSGSAIAEVPAVDQHVAFGDFDPFMEAM
jgi:hypothetical protein